MVSDLTCSPVKPRDTYKVSLWWGAGLALFTLTFFGSSWGSGPLVLGLIVACLVGGLILIRPEYGVLVLTSTFFLSYPEVLQGSGRLTINNILGLILAMILLMRVALERRAEFLRNRQVQLGICIGCTILLTQLLPEQTPPLESLASLNLTEKRLHAIITKLMFLIFLVTFIRTRWQIMLLTWSVVFFVLVTVPNAIWNALTAAGGIEQIRATANFGIRAAANANRLAFISSIAIPVIGFAMLEFRSRAAVVLGSLAIALLVATIFLSASRSGLISLLFLAVVSTARIARRRGGKLVVLALLAAIVGGISLALIQQDYQPAMTQHEPGIRGALAEAARRLHLPQPYVDRITNFFVTERGEEGSGSLRARLQLLDVGLRMFVDHPITGVGIGNFRWVSVVDYQNTRPSALHNSYLLTMVEGGVVLFVLYMLLFWRTWRDLTLTRLLSVQMPSLRLGWLVESTRAMFALFLIFSFFADVWHETIPYLIIGLATVLKRLYQDETGPAHP